MKKWIAALIALMMAVLCAAAFAEESEPAANTEEEALALFNSVWAADFGEVDAYYMDGYWKVEITYGTSLWDYICVYDPELKALVADTSVENTKIAVIIDEEGSEIDREVLYTDGDAAFTVDEEGYLIWEDRKEDAGAGIRYEKIGRYLGAYDCGEYSMNIFWDVEETEGETFSGYKIEIEKAEGEGRTFWTYAAFYSPEDGTLRAPIGNREYQEREGEPILTVYDDGAAVFTRDEEGGVLWTDEKENAGEGLRFELSNG